LDEALPDIQAEPGRLEQVFINLLLNARDAIEEKWRSTGGDLQELKKITIKTYLRRNHVMTEVSDTGIGIPSNIRSKVFEPFYTTKKVGEGTGIGLSISYGIIKDFGGNIRIRSVPGHGACFIIRFPVGVTNG
jgi:histidine kinase